MKLFLVPLPLLGEVIDFATLRAASARIYDHCDQQGIAQLRWTGPTGIAESEPVNAALGRGLHPIWVEHDGVAGDQRFNACHRYGNDLLQHLLAQDGSLNEAYARRVSYLEPSDARALGQVWKQLEQTVRAAISEAVKSAAEAGAQALVVIAPAHRLKLGFPGLTHFDAPLVVMLTETEASRPAEAIANPNLAFQAIPEPAVQAPETTEPFATAPPTPPPEVRASSDPLPSPDDERIPAAAAPVVPAPEAAPAEPPQEPTPTPTPAPATTSFSNPPRITPSNRRRQGNGRRATDAGATNGAR
ncbi:MAG: hypothetical protein HYV42_02935 [Candidatus Magasanikbacteria bacterium]|nr:hypothetical protein [Candidatus Magasanikbacteria bacterium]